MKKKIFKTRTLESSPGNPGISIYPGHVGARVFNAGFKKEGWDGGEIYREQLIHTWLRRSRVSRKGAKKVRYQYLTCLKDTKGARPYTVMHW